MRVVVIALVCAALGFAVGRLSTSAASTPSASTGKDGKDGNDGKAAAFPLDTLLVQARFTPAFQGGVTRGVKVFAVRANTPIAELGIQNGDVLLGVGDGKLANIDDVAAALRALDGTTTIHVERRGELVDLPCAACGAKLRAFTWEPTSTAAASEAETTSAASAPLVPDGAIEAKTETHFVVKPEALRAIENGTEQLAGEARIVPAYENGQPIGFKLFSIRPGSFFTQLGLMNGDVVRAVNGMPLTTPDAALQAYAKLREAKTLTVDIKRRGAPLTLEYELQK